MGNLLRWGQQTACVLARLSYHTKSHDSVHDVRVGLCIESGVLGPDIETEGEAPMRREAQPFRGPFCAVRRTLRAGSTTLRGRPMPHRGSRTSGRVPPRSEWGTTNARRGPQTAVRIAPTSLRSRPTSSGTAPMPARAAPMKAGGAPMTPGALRTSPVPARRSSVAGGDRSVARRRERAALRCEHAPHRNEGAGPRRPPSPQPNPPVFLSNRPVRV
jgi:hypothetical protein